MFEVRESRADHVVCKWKGVAPQPPRCFKAIHVCNKRHHVITMFEVRESRADHVVCKWKGVAPPNPLAVLKPSMLAIKTSYHHYVCSDGELCRSFGLQMAEAAPPIPPLLSPPMFAITSMYQAITRFAVREGCAAYFVRA